MFSVCFHLRVPLTVLDDASPFVPVCVVRLLGTVEFAVELDHPSMYCSLGDGQSQTVICQPLHPSFPVKQYVVDVLLRLVRRHTLQALEPAQRQELKIFLTHYKVPFVHTSFVAFEVAA